MKHYIQIKLSDLIMTYDTDTNINLRAFIRTYIDIYNSLYSSGYGAVLKRLEHFNTITITQNKILTFEEVSRTIKVLNIMFTSKQYGSDDDYKRFITNYPQFSDMLSDKMDKVSSLNITPHPGHYIEIYLYKTPEKITKYYSTVVDRTHCDYILDMISHITNNYQYNEDYRYNETYHDDAIIQCCIYNPDVIKEMEQLCMECVEKKAMNLSLDNTDVEVISLSELIEKVLDNE